MADKDTGAEGEKDQMGRTPNLPIQSKSASRQTGARPNQATQQEGQAAQTGRRMVYDPPIEPYVPRNFNWYYPPSVAVPPSYPPPNPLCRYVRCFNTNKLLYVCYLYTMVTIFLATPFILSLL
jgi:hypothetical protein